MPLIWENDETCMKGKIRTVFRMITHWTTLVTSTGLCPFNCLSLLCFLLFSSPVVCQMSNKEPWLFGLHDAVTWWIILPNYFLWSGISLCEDSYYGWNATRVFFTTQLKYVSRWWFQIFFIFTPIRGRFLFWLIFFKGVETTNQTCSEFDSNSSASLASLGGSTVESTPINNSSTEDESMRGDWFRADGHFVATFVQRTMINNLII